MRRREAEEAMRMARILNLQEFTQPDPRLLVIDTERRHEAPE